MATQYGQASSLQQQKAGIERQVKTLINNDLKEICRREHLPISGVKAQLQKRIIEHLNTLSAVDLERMAYRVRDHGRSPPPHALQDRAVAGNVQVDRSTPISPVPNRPAANAYSRPSTNQYQNHRTFGAFSRLQFKNSPFYHVEGTLLDAQDLPEMPQNRHTVTHSVSLDHTVADRLKADPSLRVMLYCAATSGISQYGFLDIAFPNQLEVRINGDEVKHNFKGLKNKTGTTKPADVTEFIRKIAGYNNIVMVTYALTAKKYSFVVNLVRKSTPEELSERVKNGKIISKERVIQEMVNKANDPDIEATSTVMSLKDPISTTRITLPCRSTVCTHNQCFDGSYFLMLQEQAPTWTCPVCNKAISYEGLCVDQYVLDILRKTSSSTEQVTIEPKGEWRPVTQKDDAEGNRGKSQPRAAYDEDSDDDIVEIQDSRINKVKTEANSMTPALNQQTPPLSSREASTVTSSAARPGGNKRQSAVIDLTLSDDDEPPRPAKRTNTSQNNSYNTPSSLPDGRNADVVPRQPSVPRPSLPAFPNTNNFTLAPILLNANNANRQTPQPIQLPWVGGPPPYGNYRDPPRGFSDSPG